jgi:hypothetical protein
LGGGAFFLADEDKEAPAPVFLNGQCLSWWPWKEVVVLVLDAAAVAPLIKGKRTRLSKSY